MLSAALEASVPFNQDSAALPSWRQRFSSKQQAGVRLSRPSFMSAVDSTVAAKAASAQVLRSTLRQDGNSVGLQQRYNG
jgi:hypothetical protein